jgi:tRNA threonylcarbamoyladenosine biosynthesis protein TsaB
VQDVDEINVEEGPGSYTGLKVGVSVANALSFALGKKVNGKMIGEIVEPTYE